MVMIFVVNTAGIGFGKVRMDVTTGIGMGFGQEAIPRCWIVKVDVGKHFIRLSDLGGFGRGCRSPVGGRAE